MALPVPLSATVPPLTFATVKVGDDANPLVNFRMSTAMLDGVPVMFFASVPCGIARKCRYSSSRV